MRYSKSQWILSIQSNRIREDVNPINESTISTFEFFERFPDRESARLYLEARRWPNGPRCPVCDSGERIAARKGGYYRCNRCKEDFTVRTDTVLERSHVPLHKWLYAIYLIVTSRKGISSPQLAQRIGVTQTTAWFVLRRLREACKEEAAPTMESLDAIADVVLAYRPKPKSKAAKKRKRKAKKKKAVEK